MILLVLPFLMIAAMPWLALVISIFDPQTGIGTTLLFAALCLAEVVWIIHEIRASHLERKRDEELHKEWDSWPKH